jgi:hypothetical protein
MSERLDGEPESPERAVGEELFNHTRPAENAGEIATLEAAHRPSTPNRPDDFWWIEIWYKFRAFFVDWVVLCLIFGLVFVGLEFVHRVMARSALELGTKVLLNKFHLYAEIVNSVIFVVSLIIRGALKLLKEGRS